VYLDIWKRRIQIIYFESFTIEYIFYTKTSLDFYTQNLNSWIETISTYSERK